MVRSLQITGVAVHGARLAAIMTSRGVSRLLTLNPRDFQ